MSGLGVEIDLDKVAHNARTLVERLTARGIAVTGVTKAMLGLPALAAVLVEAGISTIGDSRVENLERLRAAGVHAPTLLLRSPMLSQADRVVRVADASCNTEPVVLAALDAAASQAGLVHGVVLMVELGDLREGILPCDLTDVAATTEALPALHLVGIGANLACRSGVIPDEENMAVLSMLSTVVEDRLGRALDVVSGGNSANLTWALEATDVGRITDLRLGEAILLGRDPVARTAIVGLHTDAVTIVAEVIESKRKPSAPWGSTGEAAWGPVTAPADRGDIWQTILAIGHQDTDPAGLGMPEGVRLLGASSDHLVVETPRQLTPGDGQVFRPDYGALVRAMTSPFAQVRTT